MRKLPQRVGVLVLGAAASFLSACGGGGGSHPTLNGTVAAGAAIAGAPVAVKDSMGASVTTNTDGAGRYSVNVNGMTPPFLAEATAPGGDLFSIATETGTANIDLYTNLMADAFYAVQGTTPEVAFVTFGTGSAIPNPVETQALEALVERTIQPWLAANGVDPAAFDIGTTPFAANGMGYDHVLEITTITAPAGLTGGASTQGMPPATVATINITEGATTQNSILTADTLGNVVVDSVTTGPNGTSSSQDSTTIPPTTPARDAETAVMAALEQFKDTVNANGATLTSADLQPLMASNLLDGGKDLTVFSADVATFLRGLAVDSFTVSRINSFDALNEILDVEAALSVHEGAQMGTEQVRLVFKKVGADYVIYGDQRVARIDSGSVRFEKRTDSTSTGDTTNTSINVDASAPVNTVSSITVSGPGGFSNTPVVKDAMTRTDVLRPTPTTTLNFVQDEFFVNSGPITLPSTPASYTLTVNQNPAGTQVYTVTVTGSAGEAITFSVNPSTHSVTAVKGQTITVSWSLPQTYAADRIQLSGEMSDGTTDIQIEPSPRIIAATSTSATLTFTPPAGTPNPSSFNPVSFNLNFDGPNGERSVVIYLFDQP